MELGSIIDFIGNFGSATIRLGTPILIASMGVVFSSRSGIVNIGVEGTMLIGALAGVTGSYLTGSAVIGGLLATLAGALMGLLFGYLVITVRADQVVIGTAFNLLGLGLTTSFSRVIFGVTSTLPKITGYKTYTIPLLSQIPIIGRVFFSHSTLVYVGFGLVAAVYYVVYKTCPGLSVRAVGEHPRAADCLGINVYRTRYACTVIDGALSGLAGSYLSLGLLNVFTENMVAGRGFIAMAAVIFGKWTPVGAALGAYLFGAGDALQLRLQAMGFGIPYQFLQIIPYILTVLVLAGFVGRATPPAATGVPYSKE